MFWMFTNETREHIKVTLCDNWLKRSNIDFLSENEPIGVKISRLIDELPES